MRSRMTISRIDPVSVAKVMGLLYGVIGFIPAMFVAIAAVADLQSSSGLLLAILLPVLYAIGGAIGGLIMGFVYNLVAGAIGGVVIDLDEHVFE